MRSLWKEELSRARWQPLETRRPGHGEGLQAGRGPRVPGSQAGARGGASQAGQLPAEAGSTRDTGRVSSGPQKGQSLGYQDRCVANWPHGGSAPPLQWGLPYAPHLGVGASGGKEGEGRQEDGGGPVSASPPPRRHGGSLSLCLTAWEMLALGHLACDGAESPKQLAHSTQAVGEQDRGSPPVPGQDLPLSDAWGWAGL